MLNKNKVYEIEITDLTIEGCGVGRIDGIAVFVDGTVPDDTCSIKIIKSTKNYCVGKLLEVIKPSDKRVTAPCSVFGKCGGCSLQHLSYDGQLEYKHNYVKNCLTRIGGCDAKVLPPLPCKNEYYYRNKVAFPSVQTDTGIKIGCYSRRSHNVIEPLCCMLHSAEIDYCLKVVKRWAVKYLIKGYNEKNGSGIIRHVVVRMTTYGEIMLALAINASDIEHKSELIEMLKSEVPGLKSVMLNINMSGSNVILSNQNKLIYGQDYITENILGLKFRISLNTFLQVNSLQTEELYQTIFSLAGITKQDVVLDLYCGAGTITLNAAIRAKHVYGVEIVNQAVLNARQNAELNQVDNVTFINDDCAQAVKKILSEAGKVDIVIVDPPRKGLESSVLHDIIDVGAEKIVYVSCDPATLARDVKLFEQNGYLVEIVQPVDMFCQTTHVETVVLMSRQAKTQI